MLNIQTIARTARQLPRRNNIDPRLSLPRLEMPTAVRVFTLTANSRSFHIKPNVHFKYVLMVNVKGSALTLIDGFPVHFKPSQALMIFPDQFPICKPLRAVPRLWIGIAFRLPGRSIPLRLKYTPFRLAARPKAFLEMIVRDYADSQRATPYFSARIRANLWWLLLALSANADPLFMGQPASRNIKPRHYAVMQKVHQYINDHFNESIFIHDVARQVNLSSNALERLFRNGCGKSLCQFIRHQRLAYAARLIYSSAAGLKAIAPLCGYRSVHAFSLAFKKATGYSPRDCPKNIIRQFARSESLRGLPNPAGCNS